jgi:probable rRNA maturation factor
MYNIDFQIELENPPVLPQNRMATAIMHVLDLHEAAPESAITVVITDDEAVRILNQKYRDVDAPTDILSFPADPLPELPDDLEVDLENEEDADYLGDLIIAYPYTATQAQEAGHTLDDELTLLVIHGTLHLLGYDHDTPENEAEMWETQADILAALNIPITVPRFHAGDHD